MPTRDRAALYMEHRVLVTGWSERKNAHSGAEKRKKSVERVGRIEALKCAENGKVLSRA